MNRCIPLEMCLVFLAGMLVDCTVDHTVRLVVQERGGQLAGFSCDQADGGALLDRARDAGGSISLVVDFITIGDASPPSCALDTLFRFCTDNSCGAVPPAHRNCQTVRTTDAGVHGLSFDLQSLMPFTHNAPNGLVIVRLFATTQSCDDFNQSAPIIADPSRVMGCAFSCAVDLDHWPGDLVLDFPSLGSRCSDQVEFCASGGR